MDEYRQDMAVRELTAAVEYAVSAGVSHRGMIEAIVRGVDDLDYGTAQRMLHQWDNV